MRILLFAMGLILIFFFIFLLFHLLLQFYSYQKNKNIMKLHCITVNDDIIYAYNYETDSIEQYVLNNNFPSSGTKSIGGPEHNAAKTLNKVGIMRQYNKLIIGKDGLHNPIGNFCTTLDGASKKEVTATVL